jgi:hypothetical protein
MRETIDKLYLLMIQSLRYEMGLIDDKTWCENLDILLEAERDQAKKELNNKFGVSTAGYDNNSIFNSCLDEQFWSQNDVWKNAEEPKIFRPRYMVYRIKEIIRGGASYTFIFESEPIAAEVRKKLEEHVVKKYIDGISSIFMDGYRLKIDFKDHDSQTDFFASYVFHENGYLSLKFKKLESD